MGPQNDPRNSSDRRANPPGFVLPTEHITSLGRWNNVVRGEVEHVFEIELGLANPTVTDHVARLAARSLATGGLLPIDPHTGAQFETIRDLREGLSRKEYSLADLALLHTGIGDFALYSCVQREMFARSPKRRDLLDLQDVGKQAYRHAMLMAPEGQEALCLVCKTLADSFDLVRYGLTKVNKNLLAMGQ